MQISELHERFLSSTGVTTDTRRIEEGNIFFALKGPTFNGNEFALQALESGASLCVVDEDLYEKNDRVWLVDDVLTCLQELAGYHRKLFRGYVFALTGSNGKTTTKELIHAVISTEKKALATQGNLNNHIGVPITLLRIVPETEVAIIEMGANHLGEIKRLCEIADPDGGLITNIGKAHIGTFGGFENIIRGKSELYDHLLKKGGDIWVNTSDPVLNNMKKRFEKPMTYPAAADYCPVLQLDSSSFVTFEYSGQRTRSNLAGSYNFHNISAAAAVGKFFGITPDHITAAISGYLPENNRSQIMERGSHTLMMDAYNANPTSMKAALSHFVSTKSEKPKWVVIGSMFELGEDEQAEHHAVGEWLKEQPVEPVFVGELMQYAREACGRGNHFNDAKEAGIFLQKALKTPSFLLIKGSRGMKLEQILDFI